MKKQRPAGKILAQFSFPLARAQRSCAAGAEVKGSPALFPSRLCTARGAGEGSAHPGPTMATPEPTLILRRNSARIIINGMQPHQPNFLQMKYREIPAKWFQPPQESVETGQMLLEQERRSGFSAPAKRLSCSSSPWLVPLPGTLPGSHGHHKVPGGLLNLSFICEHGTTELFTEFLITTIQNKAGALIGKDESSATVMLGVNVNVNI